MSTFHLPASLATLEHLDVAVEAYVGPDTGWVPCPMFDGQAAFALHVGLPKRMDLRRPAAAHAVVDRARAGVRCRGGCDGEGKVSEEDVHASWVRGKCPVCRGSGYARAPHDLSALLPLALGGRVAEVEHSAALLVRSVEGIAAGAGPVKGVLGIWRVSTCPIWGHFGSGSVRDLIAPASERYVGVSNDRTFGPFPNGAKNVGWCMGLTTGPETGDLGREAADRAALRARFALLDGDVLRLPGLA